MFILAALPSRAVNAPDSRNGGEGEEEGGGGVHNPWIIEILKLNMPYLLLYLIVYGFLKETFNNRCINFFYYLIPGFNKDLLMGNKY